MVSIGDKFGRLTILSFGQRVDKKCSKDRKSNLKRKTAICQCDCGNLVEPLFNSVSNGDTKSCGCLLKEVAKKTRYKGNHLFSSTWFTTIKTRAKLRNLPFDLNEEDVFYLNETQKGLCHFTGDRLFFPKNATLIGGCSVDRIDNTKGYSRKNCWLTTGIANVSRWDLTPEEYENYCRLIYLSTNLLTIPPPQNGIEWRDSINCKWIDRYVGRMFNAFKHTKVERRKVEITSEQIWKLYTSQGGICALSGLPIWFGRNSKSTTASVDRIDSTINYKPDNCWLIHKDINLMKLNHTMEDFIQLISKIVKHRNLI